MPFGRTLTIFIVFLLLAAYIGYHLTQLQVINANEWQAIANDKQLQSTILLPKRGTIYDSEGRAMAESASVWNLAVDPNYMSKSTLRETTVAEPARFAAAELARLLEMDEEELYGKLKNIETQYIDLKVEMNRTTTDAVEALAKTNGLKGLIVTESSKRFYPYEDLAGTVLGFMNSDGVGIYGIEAKYEEVLRGTPGRIISSYAGEMPGETDAKTFPAEDGNGLMLTINADIQQAAQTMLQKAVDQYQPKEGAIALVMDVNTGAILANVNIGGYNPNNPYYIMNDTLRESIDAMADGEEKEAAQLDALYTQWKNKAVSDSYEPGSVFKVITAAAALDSGKYTADSPFACGGKYTVADRDYGCASGATHGQLSLREALIESCNISFIQIGAGIGATTWYDYLNSFGLTEPTGVDLPGEPTQSHINVVTYSESQMTPVNLASCSFGQANKYTALQMITAVSTAVNGGHLVQPHVVSRIVDANGNTVQDLTPSPKRQVISEETSIVLRGILEDLVNRSEGSGSNAYVAGYHVGGKSGTSEKKELFALEGREEYISSFMGFAPADDPQIAVLVVLDEPVDTRAVPNYFGGRLAGPTVGAIIKETVQILGIEPDYAEGEIARTTLATPSLVNQEISSALVSLNAAGLNSKIMGDGNTVLGQYPLAGTQIPRGGQVVLYTDASIVEQRVSMPDLLGKNAKTAMNTLQSLGLNVIVTGAPESGANVVVTEQSYQPGDELPMGSVVTLVLQDQSGNADH